MIRRFRFIAALLLLLVLATPALAQSGELIYRDDAGKLDRSRVQSAAQRLITRGATVAVYTANSGGDAAFRSRLEQDGLASGSSIRSDVIAIFVSLDDRYSGIRFGDRWNAALATNNNYEQIRTDALNAGLSPAEHAVGKLLRDRARLRRGGRVGGSRAARTFEDTSQTLHARGRPDRNDGSQARRDRSVE